VENIYADSDCVLDYFYYIVVVGWLSW